MSGDEFKIIAGPCSVESNDQILTIAEFLKENNVDILRGGTFKPRTSINSFQGLREKGIEYLINAKEATSMPIVTELLTIEQVKEFGKYIDYVQIGSRNMYNYELLKELGKYCKNVILKRGLSATYNEWLCACEYIKSENNNINIILCERGVRSFDSSTRNVLDIQSVPYIKNNTNYNIIVDPSHAAGNRYMIESMSLASVAAGANGIMVEVHNDPNNALSDGNQSLDFVQFKSLNRKVRTLRNSLNNIK